MLWKRDTLLLFLSFLIIWGNMSIVSGQGTITDEFDANFGYQYSKSLEKNDSIDFTAPDLADYSNQNLTDTSVVNATTYEWEDELTSMNDTYYNITVSLYRIDIYHDKDIGAGEIYFNTYVNNYNERLPISGQEYSLNDGENASINLLIFNSISTLVLISIEVMEYDSASSDDSLGLVEYLDYTPSNVSGYIDTDTSDARVYFTVTAYSLNRSITAGELLNGMKPSLNIDDEVGNIPPYQVFGRVSEGNDNGTNVIILQYMYYWLKEEYISGVTLHQNDFEMLLIYLNISDAYSPYRIVFNNYGYFEGGDPSEDLLILEKGAQETTLEFTTRITEDLQILLGPETTQTVTYKPLSDIENWKYSTFSYTNAWSLSLLGYSTLDLTVDTRYHSFDLGPGGDYIGYHYEIQAFNHSIIQSLYAYMNTSMEQGTHFVFSQTPVLSPFTFDVKQLLTAPYLISSYIQIVENIKMYERAKDSGLNITQTLEIGFNVIFPGKIAFTHPTSIIPGSTNSVTLELIKSDDIILTLFYNYTINMNFSYWFMQLDTTYNNVGEIEINIDTGVLSPILKALGLDKFEYDDLFSFGDYLSFDSLIITPKLIGTIVSGSISINLWEVLSFVIGKIFPGSDIILYIIGYFIDHMDLTAEFSLVSFVETDISSSDVELSESSITFTEDSMINSFNMILAKNTKLDKVLINISNLDYKMTMSIDWIFNMGFNKPISYLIPDFSWNIGTYPMYTAEIAETNGGSFSVNVQKPNQHTNKTDEPSLISGTTSSISQQVTSDTNSIPEINSPNQTAKYNLNLSIIGILVFSLIIRKKK